MKTPHIAKKLLDQYQHKNSLDEELVEQDYAISWILYGIAHVETLCNHLIFKAGACLKKCYFEKYRFSQELEFSGLQSCPTGTDLENFFTEAMHQANIEVDRRAYNIEFSIERYKRTLSKTQESFTVFVRYPWHRESYIKIKVVVSLFEDVHLEKLQHSIIHPYGEDLSGIINTYFLEEMMAMQIISLLNFSKIIQKQGWTSSKIREFYDLWFLVCLPGNYLDKTLIPEIVWKKCIKQNIEFKFPSALFDPRLLLNFEMSWNQWISPFDIKLTDKDAVWTTLKKFFQKTFS